MQRIGLAVLALGICAVSAAHAQSWNHNTYEAGPGGTPPIAAYGYPPYSARCVLNNEPICSVAAAGVSAASAGLPDAAAAAAVRPGSR